MTIYTQVKAAKSALQLDHGLAIGTPVLTLEGILPAPTLYS